MKSSYLRAAKEDKIRFKYYGDIPAFFPICEICKKEYMSYVYRTEGKHMCYSCKTGEKNNKFQEKHDAIFKRAVKRINSRECFFMAEYDVIKKIDGVAADISKFKDVKVDSTEEAMTAIALTAFGIPFTTQEKVLNYRVDFMLSDYKIIIEIDGIIYHQDKEKDIARDKKIINYLGSDWIVIRVTDNYVNNYLENIIYDCELI